MSQISWVFGMELFSNALFRAEYIQMLEACMLTKW